MRAFRLALLLCLLAVPGSAQIPGSPAGSPSSSCAAQPGGCVPVPASPRSPLPVVIYGMSSGYSGSPLVTLQAPPNQITQCPPNPISKKVPPLC